MRPSVPDVHITDPQDAELAEYRALAGQAVLGLDLRTVGPAGAGRPAALGHAGAGNDL